MREKATEKTGGYLDLNKLYDNIKNDKKNIKEFLESIYGKNFNANPDIIKIILEINIETVLTNNDQNKSETEITKSIEELYGRLNIDTNLLNRILKDNEELVNQNNEVKKHLLEIILSQFPIDFIKQYPNFHFQDLFLEVLKSEHNNRIKPENFNIMINEIDIKEGKVLLSIVRYGLIHKESQSIIKNKISELIESLPTILDDNDWQELMIPIKNQYNDTQFYQRIYEKYTTMNNPDSLEKFKTNTLFLGDCIYNGGALTEGYSIGKNLNIIGKDGATIDELTNMCRGNELFLSDDIQNISINVGYNDFCGLSYGKVGESEIVFKKVLQLTQEVNSKRKEKGLDSVHFFINTTPPFARYAEFHSQTDFKGFITKFLERRKYNNILASANNPDITVVDIATILGDTRLQTKEDDQKIQKIYDEILKLPNDENIEKKAVEIYKKYGYSESDILLIKSVKGFNVPVFYSEFLNDGVDYDNNRFTQDRDGKDFSGDGMHLTPDGYKILRTELRKNLENQKQTSSD